MINRQDKRAREQTQSARQANQNMRCLWQKAMGCAFSVATTMGHQGSMHRPGNGADHFLG